MQTNHPYTSEMGLPSPLPSPTKEEIPDLLTSVLTGNKEMEIKPHSKSVFVFEDISYTVKDKKGKKKNGGHLNKNLLMSVRGSVASGEMMAIMGPSGSGKSTLLDVLSFRKNFVGNGKITLNGTPLTAKILRPLASYVEQDDDHIGVLTARETIAYATKLSNTSLDTTEIKVRVDTLLTAFGLEGCADVKIGTPIQRGLSGGQKRRVTVACGLVTFPRILFLDEPTSGLDSASAREVISSIKKFAQMEGIAVIASIHAPSFETLSMFDHVMVLTAGKVAYNGSVVKLAEACEAVGSIVPEHANPADRILDLVSTDFGSQMESKRDELIRLAASSPGLAVNQEMDDGIEEHHNHRNPLQTTLILCHRSFINYIRNPLAYGVRLAMYAGMGMLLALIWIRLGNSDSTINDRLSVHFFSVAFLAFMSVAGIPAFLEERSVFVREKHNGLYGPLPFLVSNTIMTIPFLLACALFFSVICYWAIGLQNGAGHFFQWLIYLFLALFAAESQVVVIAAICPIFIAALALGAFMNGFWMCVQGYFIKARSLPRFWYYSFHFMDYQTYAFELLATNDLVGVTFDCNSAVDAAGKCVCSYPPSALTTQLYGSCAVSGQDVVNYLEFGGIPMAGYAGIMIGICVIYRVLLYLVLRYTK